MALSLLALLGRPAGAEEEKEIRKVVVLGQGGGYLGVRLDEVDSETVGRLKLPEERGAAPDPRRRLR